MILEYPTFNCIFINRKNPQITGNFGTEINKKHI